MSLVSKPHRHSSASDWWLAAPEASSHGPAADGFAPEDMVIKGTEGDDMLRGNDGNDIISGLRGNDILKGRAGDDQLMGGSGDDILIGGTGSNMLAGGKGSDTISYEDVTAAITVTGGTKGQVSIAGFASDHFAGVERFISGSGDDHIGGGFRIISAGAGDDTIVLNLFGGFNFDGGTGVNSLELGGFTSHFGFTANLSTGMIASDEFHAWGVIANIENLSGGSGGDDFLGDGSANILAGHGGADTLENGGAASGIDRLSGDDGNDVLLLDLEGHIQASGGDDDDSFVLSDTNFSGVAQVEIDGGKGVDGADFATSAAVTVNLADHMVNSASGLSGSIVDVENLTGSAHDDVLVGDDLGNTFIDSAGQDTVTGGGGADIFSQSASYHSSGQPEFIVTDFSSGDHDKIDVSQIDANAGRKGAQEFVFVGDAAFDGHAGELRFEIREGNTFILADTDGDKAADFSIELNGSHDLISSDFTL